MKNLIYRLNRFTKTVFEMMRKPVMSILPGQMSFFLLLALIPMLLLIGVIASSFSVSTNGIVDFITQNFPASTSKMLLPLIVGKGFDYNIVILVFSALLLVSKSTKSIIVAASAIYKVEDVNPIKDTVKSFVIAVLLVLLLLFIIVIPVFGSKILLIISSITGDRYITSNVINAYNMAKWPISIFIIFFNLKLIYTMAPNKLIKSHTVTRGAIFTTVLWVIATFIYSFYITHLASYNIFYGSASNIIVLMLWVYLISYIFVLGMSINASMVYTKDVK